MSGQGASVFHYPDPKNQKLEDLKTAIKRKLEQQDYNFRDASFCDGISFNDWQFTKDANFDGAKFSGRANFRGAKFAGTCNFDRARFEADADFGRATFRGRASFHAVHFVQNVSLRAAEFLDIADFSAARFHGYARFVGDEVFSKCLRLNLEFVRIDKPEHVLFHSVTLKAEWFVNVDVRKFDLINTDWEIEGRLERHLERGIDALVSNSVGKPHLLLSTTYSQLAVNAEESRNYDIATAFRYCSLELTRWRIRYRNGKKGYDIRSIRKKVRSHLLHPGAWMAGWRWIKKEFNNRYHIAVLSLTWWYWLTSGYSERARRAAVMLGSIIVSFAALYAGLGPVCTSQNYFVTLPAALVYSFEVSLLQRPDPRPSLAIHHTLVDLEIVLVPLQATLLALAIRRKFMR